MSVLDQNGRIQALGFLSWLCPLQVTQPIANFLNQNMIPLVNAKRLVRESLVVHDKPSFLDHVLDLLQQLWRVILSVQS